MKHVTVLAGFLAVFSQAAAAQTLTIGARSGPESMDPHFAAARVHVEIARHMFDTLILTDENLQLVPGLAVSWEPITDTTWEVKLREGVKFHDGSEMTAEDVAFSIARPHIVTGPSSTIIYVRRVQSVDIVDPLTLHIHTDGPAPALPYDFTRVFVVSAAAAADYNTPETAPEGFNSGAATIGTGPYKYVSWEPMGDLVLERFDDHWRGVGPWERVVRREIPNDTSRLAALKAGQVDLVSEVSPVDYQALRTDPAVDVIIGDSIYILNLYLDQREHEMPGVRAKDGSALPVNPLTNPLVREALDTAIDREAIVEVVLEGLGKPADQIMPPGFFGYSEEAGNPDYDPGRARELLAEAGYPDGFQLDLNCTTDRSPGDSAICQAMGQMFTAIGVDTNVNAITGTVFFPAQARGEFSASNSQWGTLTGEGTYTLISMVHTKDDERGLGAWNRIHSNYTELDELIRQSAVELDTEKRRAIVEQAMKMMREARMVIPLIQSQAIWAAPAGKLEFTPRIDQETLAFFIKPVGE